MPRVVRRPTLLRRNQKCCGEAGPTATTLLASLNCKPPQHSVACQAQQLLPTRSFRCYRPTRSTAALQYYRQVAFPLRVVSRRGRRPFSHTATANPHRDGTVLVQVPIQVLVALARRTRPQRQTASLRAYSTENLISGLHPRNLRIYNLRLLSSLSARKSRETISRQSAILLVF